MSYPDLPDSVKITLPDHAQEIYKNAFDAAWKSYGLRLQDESRAHAVAWSAVKQHYHQNDEGEWVEGAADQPTGKRTLDERRIF